MADQAVQPPSGFKSSEFAGTLTAIVAFVSTFLVGAGYITQADANNLGGQIVAGILGLGAFIAMAKGLITYIRSRHLIKSGNTTLMPLIGAFAVLLSFGGMVQADPPKFKTEPMCLFGNCGNSGSGGGSSAIIAAGNANTAAIISAIQQGSRDTQSLIASGQQQTQQLIASMARPAAATASVVPSNPTILVVPQPPATQPFIVQPNPPPAAAPAPQPIIIHDGNRGSPPAYVIPGGGAPNYTIPGGGAPNYQIPGGGAPNYQIPGGGAPNYQIPGGGTPNYTVPGGGNPIYIIPGGGAPAQPINGGGAIGGGGTPGYSIGGGGQPVQPVQPIPVVPVAPKQVPPTGGGLVIPGGGVPGGGYQAYQSAQAAPQGVWYAVKK